MKSLLQQLEDSSIFSQFSPQARKEIEKLAIQRKYKKDELVVHQDDLWPYLLFVNKGSINAIKDSIDGRSYVAATFSEGEVFWGVTFFDEGHKMPAGLIANEESVLFLWHRDTLLPFILQEGRFSWQLCKLLMERLLYASDKINDMTFHTVEVRLAKFLLSISSDDVGIPIERSLTLDEIAARIGTTREMVCRLLHKFSDNQIIDINRTEFTIKDWQRLKDTST